VLGGNANDHLSAFLSWRVVTIGVATFTGCHVQPEEVER
jgi:hypothetical protein